MAKARRFNSLTFYVFAALAYLGVAIFLYFLSLNIIGSPDEKTNEPPTLGLRLVSFDALDGWNEDDLRPAAAAFSASCEKLEGRRDNDRLNPLESHPGVASFSLTGTVADWRRACSDIPTFIQTPRIRAYFEANFTPIQILNRYVAEKGTDRFEPAGKFTGYFEPEYKAAREKTPEQSVPVLSRPNDLIDLDLGAFRPELSGTRIAGRLEGRRLVPYPDHGDIIDGALTGRAEPLAWVNPNDLLFLQIQGSGRLRLKDGTTLRVGYAGQNGHPYTAVGKVLADEGIMPVSEISMQSIQTWLRDAGIVQAKALREANKSYVFFTVLDELDDDEGPLGAQGIPLVAGRSLAVDRRYHAMGAPVWISTEAFPAPGPGPIKRLMVAQDTGGAIRGPVRGDFYWGTGEIAGDLAGRMNVSGELFILVPKTVAARIPEQYLQ